MRRTLMSFVALCPLILGLCGATKCVAEDKKEKDKQLKFTCAVHGPDNMTLTLVIGAKADKPRKVEIIGTGNSTTQWTVKIDGEDKTPDNKGEVPVGPGDSITWKVEGGNTHGVLFHSKKEAEAVLEFDTTMGKELADRDGKGDFKWGTEGFGDGTTLAVATVKASKKTRKDEDK